MGRPIAPNDSVSDRDRDDLWPLPFMAATVYGRYRYIADAGAGLAVAIVADRITASAHLLALCSAQRFNLPSWASFPRLHRCGHNSLTPRRRCQNVEVKAQAPLYHAGFRRGSAAQLAHETLDRGVALPGVFLARQRKTNYS